MTYQRCRKIRRLAGDCARKTRAYSYLEWSSPGEKLSLIVVVAAEAVGRWREVERGPAFHNSAVGRVGRATVGRPVRSRSCCVDTTAVSGGRRMDLCWVLVVEGQVWSPMVVEPDGFIDSASCLVPADEGPSEAVLLFEDAVQSFCN